MTVFDNDTYADRPYSGALETDSISTLSVQILKNQSKEKSIRLQSV